MGVEVSGACMWAKISVCTMKKTHKMLQGWKYLMTYNNNNPLPTSYGVSHVITVECIIPAFPHKCFLVSLHFWYFYPTSLSLRKKCIYLHLYMYYFP